MQVNVVSKQREYQGSVRSKVGAMSNMPHGGQIIVDADTYRDLVQHQSELQNMVEAHPDYDALAGHTGRWALALCALLVSATHQTHHMHAKPSFTCHRASEYRLFRCADSVHVLSSLACNGLDWFSTAK